MATKYYVDTAFEEEEQPSSSKMGQFNERIKAGFQLVSNALVDMTGDDTVLDDVGRSDELKVTASSPADMSVHVAIGVACVDGQVCQVDCPVVKTIVAPTTNPRYTIIQVDEDGNVKTIDGVEAASPVEPDAEDDAMKLAAIYLTPSTTEIETADITDRRVFQAIIVDSGNVGIGTTGPGAKLDVLDTSGAQLRLTYEDGVKFVDFELDTNHDLTIKPSSTGQIKFQPTTDSSDFFQVLDADGGTPILNIDSVSELIGIKKDNPIYDLDIAGKVRISGTLGVGIGPSTLVGLGVVLPGAGKQILMRLGNTQDYAADVGVQILLQVGAGLSTMATIDGACEGATNDDGYIAFSTRKSDVLTEQMRIDSDGEVILSGDISGVGGFKQPFSFMQSDVAASQSAVALAVLGLTGNSEIVMPYAGSIIGISIASNDARTAGTLTVDATVNGTVTGLQAVLDGTNTTYYSATQAKDTDTFAAGDRIGVKITTDSSWAPTTADIVVAVIIEM